MQAVQVAGERPTAIVLLGADGTTYYRSGIRPPSAEADKLAAVAWLAQRSPDALARVLPDGGGILVRRDRRAPDGTVLQNLYLIKPAPGSGVVEEALPFDTAAFTAGKGLAGWRLQAISGLHVARGTRRALLRLTFEKPATPKTVTTAAETVTSAEPDTVTSTRETVTSGTAAAEPATREFLGWYDLDAKVFTDIFTEPRLVGAEPSVDGRLIHVLAARGKSDEDATALIVDERGQVKVTPVLDALRRVGYLYRGWASGRGLLLKKAGQDQVVLYDAMADTVEAPAGLDVFAASKAPQGDYALTWAGEPEEAPAVLVGRGGAPLALDFDGPVTVADWSADGRFALLLGARNERRQATKAWLLETEGTPRLREIVVPAPVAAARFLYEAL